MISKLANLVVLISLFVSTFLLSFLLMGCLDSSSTYSNVYITELRFNEKSKSYSKVKAAYKDNLEKMSVRVGYLSTCVILDKKVSCEPYNSLKKLSKYSGVTLLDSSDKMDLINISNAINSTCHPRILMAATIINLLMLIISCYQGIPLLPGKAGCVKVVCLLSSINVILWGLGAMLQNEAADVAKSIVAPSSMNVAKAIVGKRAQAMSWTAFAFLLLSCICSFTSLFLAIRQKSLNMHPKV